MSRTLLIAGLGLAMLSAHPAQAQQRKIRRRRDVITAEEIATRPDVTTAYDAIRNLRPAWRARTGMLMVYRDGVLIGGTETLQDIAVDQIKELRLLSGPDATTKYGTGNANGAIEVITKH
jgi:hypothetical protein